MSLENRVRRAVRRGIETEGLWARRSQKADKSFERWFNGLVIVREDGPEGIEWWRRVPTNNVIHKGRKP